MARCFGSRLIGAERPSVDVPSVNPDAKALEQAVRFGYELLSAETPEQAARAAVASVGRAFDAPVAGWLTPTDGGRMRLIAVSPVETERGPRLVAELGELPRWSSMLPEERGSVARRFAEIFGSSEVRAVNTAQALLLVADVSEEAQPVLDLLGSMLGEALRKQAVVSLAHRRNEQLDLSIAWTAHELTSPVLGVKAVLELMLRSEPGAGPGEALLRRSLQELEVLAGTTEDLLGYAAGARSLRRRWCDVVTIVEGAAVSSDLPSEERRVIVSAPAQILAYIDADQLRTAIANLIRNSLACGPQESEVAVIVEHRGESVYVSVRDDGPGIREEEGASIFDPFVRGSAGRGRGRGTGLGLFIARRVVEAHGGEIWLEPSSRGTAVSLQLPIGAANDDVSPHEDASQPEPDVAATA